MWCRWSKLLMLLVFIIFIIRAKTTFSGSNSKAFTGNFFYTKLSQGHTITAFAILYGIVFTNLGSKNLLRQVLFMNLVLKYESKNYCLKKCHLLYATLALFPMIFVLIGMTLGEVLTKNLATGKVQELFMASIVTIVFHMQRTKIGFFCKLMKTEALYLEKLLRIPAVPNNSIKRYIDDHERLLKTFKLFKKGWATYFPCVMLNMFFDICTSYKGFEGMATKLETEHLTTGDLVRMCFRAMYYIYKIPLVLWFMNAGERVERNVIKSI